MLETLQAVFLTFPPAVVQIYLIGGKGSNNTILDQITAYDAVLDEDTNLTSLPEPRSRFALATDNSSIWLVGGYGSSANESAGNPEVSSFFRVQNVIQSAGSRLADVFV